MPPLRLEERGVSECALQGAGLALGFLIGQQAFVELGFEAQAIVGLPQPILMVQQPVGEIGHEERPLFQADDLVPQLLETEFMPDRKPGRPDSWAGSGLLSVSVAKYSCAFSDKLNLASWFIIMLFC